VQTHLNVAESACTQPVFPSPKLDMIKSNSSALWRRRYLLLGIGCVVLTTGSVALLNFHRRPQSPVELMTVPKRDSDASKPDVSEARAITEDERRDILRLIDKAPGVYPSRKDEMYEVVRRSTSGTRLLTVYFASTEAMELPKEEQKRLLEIVSHLRIERWNLLVIEGHISEANPQRSYKLGDTRAENVAKFLIKDGFDRTRIIPLGFGTSRPIESSTSGNNDRVELVVF
jgi:outer membrane protein OmpA-like peptidoglycan-associated protein